MLSSTSCLHYLLRSCRNTNIIAKLRNANVYANLTVRTNRFRKSFILYGMLWTIISIGLIGVYLYCVQCFNVLIQLLAVIVNERCYKAMKMQRRQVTHFVVVCRHLGIYTGDARQSECDQSTGATRIESPSLAQAGASVVCASNSGDVCSGTLANCNKAVVLDTGSEVTQQWPLHKEMPQPDCYSPAYGPNTTKQPKWTVDPHGVNHESMGNAVRNVELCFCRCLKVYNCRFMLSLVVDHKFVSSIAK